MGRAPAHPLTPEKAKLRLREAADAVSPAAWVRRHPTDSLLFALLGGVIIGAYPNTSRRIIDNLVRLVSFRNPFRRFR